MGLVYALQSGKNNKLWYYLRNYAYYLLPLNWFLARRLKALTAHLEEREDYEAICRRVDYYNKMPLFRSLKGFSPLSQHHPQKQKVYFFDTYRYTILFPQNYVWSFLPGDITEVASVPSVVKSRPLCSDNDYNVLMKLDLVRHFVFVRDKLPWSSKKDRIIFRGKVLDKPCRVAFMSRYYRHPMVDAADVGKQAHRHWSGEKKTIAEHLDYKFIMALEGNDVASNLKWIMSSQSIAVMPRPTCETWFMEGLLRPNVHYIEIKPDLSDLIERVTYYIEHPTEAEAIVRNANEYVEQFLDQDREDIISYLVLKRYFERTGQR